MKTKPPPDRHKFAGMWDEIDYLYHKLLYWLYQRADTETARHYTERLELLLLQADPNHESILGEECWSLVYEANGNLTEAIKHRENEIRLIRELYAESKGQPYEKIALEGYDISDLIDRINLLAVLYHDSGDVDKAITLLRGSRSLCIRHAIPFDAEDTLAEYLKERPNITIYLCGSENGTLSVRKTAYDSRKETMPSSQAKLG